MAGITLFHYLPGRSLLHRTDPRFKIGLLLFMSLAVMSAKSPISLAILTGLNAAAVWGSHLPVKRLVSEGRPALFFGGALLLTYSWTIPGRAPIFSCIPGLTWTGLFLGLIFVWRFLLVFVAGLLFTGTTAAQDICDAMEMLLKPLPFPTRARIAPRLATMIGLTFVLTPLILDQTAEMMEAQTARSIFLVKNPLYRIRCLVIPLFNRIINRAAQLALAMEARGYSEERTPPELRAVCSDWLLLILMFSLWLLMFIR